MTAEEQIEYLKNTNLYKKPDSLYYEKQMINSKKTIPIGELVERFIDMDKHFHGEHWNIKQILAQIDIVIPIEDRKTEEYNNGVKDTVNKIKKYLNGYSDIRTVYGESFEIGKINIQTLKNYMNRIEEENES